MKLNEKRIINDIRLLALDMINNAGSGHPGIALDLAPTMYTLLAYHLKFDLVLSVCFWFCQTNLHLVPQ